MEKIYIEVSDSAWLSFNKSVIHIIEKPNYDSFGKEYGWYITKCGHLCTGSRSQDLASFKKVCSTCQREYKWEKRFEEKIKLNIRKK